MDQTPRVIQTEYYDYDAASGRLSGHRIFVNNDGASGHSVEFSLDYDKDGRLINRMDPFNDNEKMLFAYYPNGRLKSIDVTSTQSRMDDVSLLVRQRSQYVYNDRGLLISRVDSSDGGMTDVGLLTIGRAHYDYDDDRVDTVTEHLWTSDPVCSFGDGIHIQRRYNHDSLGRLTRYWAVDASDNKLVEMDFSYDDITGLAKRLVLTPYDQPGQAGTRTGYEFEEGTDLNIGMTGARLLGSLRGYLLTVDEDTDNGTPTLVIDRSRYFEVKYSPANPSAYWDGAWRVEPAPTDAALPALTMLFGASPTRPVR